jgi:hypothetical protein
MARQLFLEVPMPELSWEKLLLRIEEGDVVPIVGQDVIQVTIDGKLVGLYSYLAKQLANRLEVPFDPKDPNPLNAVAGAYLESDRDDVDLDNVYLELNKLVRETSSLSVPESLRKLAAIRPFRLFATTTFDPMLKRALDEVRFNGAPGTLVKSFSPMRTDDLDDDSLKSLKSGPPIVFHLLGKVSAQADYAVTEEDTLEFLHSLQASRPTHLFDVLDSKFLLIIGNSFSDWLNRFFIRSAKRERLWMARGRADFLADELARSESPLLSFLRRFSSKMGIFTSGGPLQFIDDLHTRWIETHGEDSHDDPPPSGPVTIPGSVFISYAHEDFAIASKVKELLDKARIDVWFDERLTGGDPFGPKIRMAIEQSAAFLPIISKNTLIDAPRWFRMEWNHAVELSKKERPDAAYIMPVVIDDTPFNTPAIPEQFQTLTWEKLDDTFPREAWLQSVRERVKQYRRSMEHSA